MCSETYGNITEGRSRCEVQFSPNTYTETSANDSETITSQSMPTTELYGNIFAQVARSDEFPAKARYPGGADSRMPLRMDAYADETVVRINPTQILTGQTDCHTIDIHTSKKETQPMSLIISMQNEHGIVFCGDSKSTQEDSCNYPAGEKGRNCRKVFQGENIIIATFGRNRLLRHNVLVPIEMVIDSILASHHNIDAEEFFDAAYHEAAESLVPNYAQPIHFVVGYKKADKYIVEHRPMIAGSHTANLYYNPTIRYFGTDKTCPRDININWDWTVEEMSQAAQTLMQSAVTVGDTFLNYNPIGGTINTVSLV